MPTQCAIDANIGWSFREHTRLTSFTKHFMANVTSSFQPHVVRHTFSHKQLTKLSPAQTLNTILIKSLCMTSRKVALVLIGQHSTTAYKRGYLYSSCSSLLTILLTYSQELALLFKVLWSLTLSLQWL